jgi:hypothetical protein
MANSSTAIRIRRLLVDAVVGIEIEIGIRIRIEVVYDKVYEVVLVSK